MPRKFFSAALAMLMFTVLACNFPIAGNSSSNEELALTITAQAQLLATSTATSTATPGAEEAVDGQPIADSSTDVTVTVSTATNCRKGPGQDFEIIISMQPGLAARVTGRNTPNDYWIIEVPGSNGDTCWLWGRHAEVTGDTSALPEIAAPAAPGNPTNAPAATPTKTPVPLIVVTQPVLVITKPSAPTLAYWGNQCVNQGGLFLYKLNIGWEDNSFNEAGFEAILTRPAGPPSKYTTTGTHLDIETVEAAGTILTVSVTAYNSAGHSAPVVAVFNPCQ